MELAYLNCPRELLFVNDQKVERPILPGYEANTEDAFQFKVDVLAIDGERALISLPKTMAKEPMQTAMVEMKYLN
jgi:hypothetical protein